MSSNGSYATAEELLAVAACKHEDVEIELAPGVKKHVQIWELTAVEYQTYQESLSSTRREVRGVGGRNPQTDIIVEATAHKSVTRLVWLALKQPNGERVFAFEEQVGKLPTRVVAELWLVAARLSQIITEEPANVAEAVVAEGKGSEETPSVSSTSGSRSRSASPRAGTSTLS